MTPQNPLAQFATSGSQDPMQLLQALGTTGSVTYPSMASRQMPDLSQQQLPPVDQGPDHSFRDNLKSSLSLFLQSLGRGYSAGGGMAGLGAALSTPWVLDAQKKQQALQAAADQQAAEEHQAKMAQMAAETAKAKAETDNLNAPSASDTSDYSSWAPVYGIPEDQAKHILGAVPNKGAPEYLKALADKYNPKATKKSIVFDKDSNPAFMDEGGNITDIATGKNLNSTFKPAANEKAPTSESDKLAYEAILKKQAQNIPLSSDEIASKKAYEGVIAASQAGANQGRQDALSDKSYTTHVKLLSDVEKPIAEAESKYSNLRDNLAQGTPEGDAVAIPQLLSFAAAGQGSGIRITQPEIKRVAGGAGKWQALKSAMQQYALDPKKANSITPDQRVQMQQLSDMIGNKLQQKRGIITDAYQQLSTSTAPSDHRSIFATTKQKLADIDGPKGSTGNTPQPSSGGGKSFVYDKNGNLVSK